MTPREKFIQALRREPIEGHVPHFELVMFLTMEAIGRIHPCHRNYEQWYQMSAAERRLHLVDMAKAYIEIAEKYDHSAIFVHPNPGPIGEMPDDIESTRAILETIRELSGDKYFLMIHGDPTYPIPTGDTMMEFSTMMYEEPEKIHQGTQERVAFAKKLCDEMAKHPGLLDGWCLCSDYCFNVNPFYSRDMFAEFVQPYLKEILDYYRAAGYYSIKHTDGNVMPILDMIVDAGPDAVHSLDPQGGVSLTKAKELYGDRVCLIGNVNCGLMQTGTEEQLVEDVRRSLREGMPGYGYIFSTSNCAFTGLALSRYELMHKVWKEEGYYGGPPVQMTGRERVLRTLAFQGTDRIPMDMWVLPAARLHHGKAFEDLCRKNADKLDIAAFVGPFDHGFTPEYYQVGKFTDPWGSIWSNLQEGVIGEVKEPVLADYDRLAGYKAPTERFLREWAAEKEALAGRIAEARAQGKFILGGWISIFERLQFLRGTEDLYCDIALEEDGMFAMMDLVMDFMRVYLDAWLEMDIDGIPFGDDWGSQRSLLISPNAWVKLFKPLYQELFDRIHAAGKKVFFHSDGYIWDLYPHFIDMGVDAVNSQLWCMGVKKVAEQFAGKITFWGEISRQDILPQGSPEEVKAAAKAMIRALHVNGGGLIGQSEINKDVPLANVEAFFEAWNEENT